MVGEQQPQQEGRGDGAEALRGDVGQQQIARQAARGAESDAHRRIDMGAGDVSQRIDHGHDHHAENEVDAEGAEADAEKIVRHHGAAAGEYQRESTHRLGAENFPVHRLYPQLPISRIIAQRNPLVL